VSGTPEYTGTTIIECDQADGISLTQPGAGRVRIDLLAADYNQAGIMTTAAQRFSGDKSFDDKLILRNPSFTELARVFGDDAYSQHALVLDSLALSPNDWRFGMTVVGNREKIYIGQDVDINATKEWIHVVDGVFTINVSNGSGGDVNLVLDGTAESGLGRLTLSTGGRYAIGADAGQTGTYGGLQVTGGLITGGSFSGGSGTVTSVGLSLPSIITVSGTPVTTSGTLTGTLAVQNKNKVWAGPTTGSDAAPTFRALVPDDLPAFVGARVHTSASTVLAGSGVWTYLIHNYETFDTDSIHTSGVFVVPAGMGGKWRFKSRTMLQTGEMLASSDYYARLLQDGAVVLDLDYCQFPAAGGGRPAYVTLTTEAIVVLTAGQFVGLQLFAGNYGVTVYYLQSSYTTWAEAEYLGR